MVTLIAKLLPAAWPLWAAEAIFYVVVSVVGLTAIHLFWDHKVAEPYRVQGDARTAKKLQPQITELTHERDQAEHDLGEAVEANKTLQTSVATLEAKLHDADASITELQTVAQKAREQARKAIAEIQARAKRDADEIARLTAVASGPPVAAAKVCAQAGDYLSELAKWRRAP